MKKIYNNIVNEKQMREIQSETLKILRETLSKSFGPYGSNTTITKIHGQSLGAIEYTKDGHTILKSIQFQDIIESATKETIEDITRNIVLKVGDGTTSAVILSSIIFDILTNIDGKQPPYKVMEKFSTAVGVIIEEIKSNVQEFTPDRAYDISYTSTNGNSVVADHIKQIYEKHGNGVYIDVAISPNEHTMLKTYDGMTLEAGLPDNAFVNTSEGKSVIRNPKIYIFEDPIDTPLMGAMLDSLINHNIMKPLEEERISDVIPTVIITPKISRDFGSYMEGVAKSMLEMNPVNKPPLLIIPNVYQSETCDDIAHLCGCRAIRKYIDPKQYESDVEAGIAPTKENVHEFGGTADLVEADAFKTKFINPSEMYNTDRTYSDKFNNLVSYLESELQSNIENSTDVAVRHKLKKRIQSLKSNLVEYLVGGLTPSDRDNKRDLVEDAVKNCMNAAVYGIGHGANFEGLRATTDIMDKREIDPDILEYVDNINYAYIKTILCLYENSGISEDKSMEIIKESINKKMPYDIRNEEFNGNVLTSIMSDIAILESISKIMMLMITTNQFLCPDFMFNKYFEGEEI